VEISEESISLSWNKNELGYEYHFQLAEDAGFEDIIEDKEIPVSVITLSNLSTGRYYVRVAIIDSDDYHGEFSLPLAIDIPYSDYDTFYNL
jgi:hypothetical protein